MITFDEAAEALDTIALELPLEIYADLNGGINLLPDEKLHPEGEGDDLYIMGEYHNSFSMGKYIVIYYGSFAHLHGHLPPELLREELKKTLLHEFTHHFEALSGESGLVIKDIKSFQEYLRTHEKKTD